MASPGPVHHMDTDKLCTVQGFHPGPHPLAVRPSDSLESPRSVPISEHSVLKFSRLSYPVIPLFTGPVVAISPAHSNTRDPVTFPRPGAALSQRRHWVACSHVPRRGHQGSLFPLIQLPVGHAALCAADLVPRFSNLCFLLVVCCL